MPLLLKAKQSRKHKGKDGNNTQDPEAAYKIKIAADGKKKIIDGFKMHANTDEDGFVKKRIVTPSNTHDSKEFNKLLAIKRTKDNIKTLGEVYADSAYANKQNDKKLGKQNNKVLHRAYRNKPLTKQQKQDNRQRSSIRYIVERTFGLLKLHHGLGKARHLGIERNKTRAQLIAIERNKTRAQLIAIERNKTRTQLIAMSHNLKTGMTIFKQMNHLRDCCVQ